MWCHRSRHRRTAAGLASCCMMNQFVPQLAVWHPQRQHRGCPRVCQQNFQPILCVWQQDEDLGLSCQPSTSSVIRLEPGDSGGVLLLASDGLWDVTDIAAVADVAMRFLPDGPQVRQTGTCREQAGVSPSRS